MTIACISRVLTTNADAAIQATQALGLWHVWQQPIYSLASALQVNLKLFTPAPNQRRTVLLFVFRDMTKTPLQQLKATWEEDLQRMWQSITKPPHYDAYSFSDFFEVTKTNPHTALYRQALVQACAGRSCYNVRITLS